MPFSAPSSPPETSVRNRLRPKYCNPAQLRGSAVKLFEAGFGYVRAARMLNIPANTVKVEAYVAKKGLQGSVFSSRAQEDGGINQ